MSITPQFGTPNGVLHCSMSPQGLFYARVVHGGGPGHLSRNYTASHNAAFPVQGRVWGILSSKFGHVCRVSRLHACAACDAWYFPLKMKNTLRLAQRYCLCVALFLWTWVRAPAKALLFAFYFRLSSIFYFFPSHFAFCVRYCLLCSWPIYPMD